MVVLGNRPTCNSPKDPMAKCKDCVGNTDVCQQLNTRQVLRRRVCGGANDYLPATQSVDAS
ncbi:hypothetical protein E2C01_062379 [Portunus trituberculatus]|uniref:Uncharacterized protein n=1 Tax=Portunus trituberculatus TaxID=210409 RepID=A0A5B7HAY2_PORTR|nr:hypothetical protein [Portunus trituberculatus]